MTQQPRLTGPLEILQDRLTFERPLLIGARSSGSGTGAFRLAVHDLRELNTFLGRYGLDVDRHLPGDDELIAMLRATKAEPSKTPTGTPFSNRYVAIDLRTQCNVFIVLSAGTGRKVNEEYVQPFVAHMGKHTRHLKPCGVMTKRVDRLGRNAWALGDIINPLIAMDGLLGDTKRGLRSMDGFDSILVFFEASQAEQEASNLPMRTRAGQRRMTGTSLASGRCSFAVSTNPPPGMMVYQPATSGSLGTGVLTFDTDACRPAKTEVVVGLPQVFHIDDNGQKNPVDQVENIRWALERLADPAWKDQAIAAGLAQRQFSTAGRRRLEQNPAAVLTLATAKKQAPYVVRSIVKHLDFYEYGNHTLRFGVGDIEELVITDCFPPDGPWAEAETFARIRQNLAERRAPAPRKSVFSGLAATVNGQECIIGVSGDAPDGSPRLTASLNNELRKGLKGRKSPGVTVRFEPAVLIEPLVEAIAAAGEHAVALVSLDTAPIDMMLDSELDACRRGIERLEVNLEHIIDQLVTDDVNGQLRRALNHKYNDIHDVQIPQARVELTRLEADREQRIALTAAQAAGTPLASVLTLIEHLRDPYDTTYEPLVKRAIRNLTVDVTEHTTKSQSWLEYDFSFEVHIDTPEGNLQLPAYNRITYHRKGQPHRLVDDAWHRLLTERVTWADVEPSGRGDRKRWLADKLGVPYNRFMLPNVREPRLAHLVSRVLEQPDNLQTVAAEENEPIEFLHRLLDVHQRAKSARWILKDSAGTDALFIAGAKGPVTAADLELAAELNPKTAAALLGRCWWRDRWIRTDHGYEVHGCPHCGSKRRTPARVPEPDGLVCLDCEHDEAGHHWPLDTYDQYMVVGPDLVDECNNG